MAAPRAARALQSPLDERELISGEDALGDADTRRVLARQRRRGLDTLWPHTRPVGQLHPEVLREPGKARALRPPETDDQVGIEE